MRAILVAALVLSCSILLTTVQAAAPAPKGGEGGPSYGDAAGEVAKHINAATEKSEAIQNEHMKNVEKDPGSLITKEAMQRIMASSSFLPQKAGSHSISVQPGQGFNGVTNYEPAGWKITESMSGPTEKKEESAEKESTVTYPFGMGMMLLNQCTATNYTKTSPCYNSKLFDIENTRCNNLMDAANYMGVGFDGRGYYNSESRKNSLIQRLCGNGYSFLSQDVPDIMNVFGIFHTEAETKSFQSVDQYMKYIRNKAGLSNQKGLFTSEASKYSKSSSFGASLGGIGAIAGGAIGAVAGGPAGAMLGAQIGGAIGGAISGGFGKGSGSSKSTEEGESSSKIDQTEKSSNSQKTSQNFFAIMFVKIILYELTLDETKPSDLSPSLVKDYMDLPSSYYSIGADVKYQNFLLRWGTHFIRSGKFGGQLKVTKTMKTTQSLSSDEFASVAEGEFKSMFSTLQSSYSQKSSGFSILGIGSKKKSTTQKASAKAEQKYESKLAAENKKAEKLSKSDFTQTTVEAQGGTPEIAEALMDFYTPAFKQLFHDWIVSIKDYARPFEFQLKSIHDLFQMRMKDLFPTGEADFSCNKDSKSKVKIHVEAKTNKRFYFDTREVFVGKKKVEEKLKVYCKFNSLEDFEKTLNRRRISLERAIGIYMVEGPFPTSSYELPAGQVGCEDKTLTKFHLFANATKVMKFSELQSMPFMLVFDMPQPIPGIALAQSKYQVLKRGNTWFTTRPDAPEAHLYEGCSLGGLMSKKPKICFRNIVLTYDEAAGFFHVAEEDFKLSKQRMPSLPNWLSGTTVARPKRLHSISDLKRGVLNNEVAIPCNVRWLNSHRLDPNKKENCLHFTAASEGDIFVVFASIPRAHTTWRYLQINADGVAFYKGFRLENRIQRVGMGVLGDANLYQSYFVCVIQTKGSVLMQYGKADPDSEVGTVYASYKYPDSSHFSRLSFYSFGSGDKSASLMDIRLTKQMPVVKCLDEDYIKKDGHCVLNCHAECDGCKRARDNKACQRCRNVRVQHTTVIECLSQCPAGMTLSSSKKGLCVPCAAGSYKFKVGNGACTPCNPGAFSPAGAKMCTPCAKGTYNAKSGQAKCQKCPAGRFSSRTGAQSCSTCPISTYSDAGAVTCSACPYGHYGNSAGLTKCKPCSAGYYAPNRGQRSCSKCPVGTTSAQGSRSCGNSCSKGQYSPRKGVPCRTCAAGTYSESAGSSSCSNCAAGSYQPRTGQSSCIKAPKGSYVSGSASKSYSKCPAGSYSDKEGQTSSSVCKKCAAGTYASASGSTSCTPCPVGKYQRSIGQSSCASASPGYFVSGTGKATQNACPHGTYASSSASASCKRCPQGYYAPSVASSSCRKCNAGYYAAHTGMRACSKCASGSTSSAGASSCGRCGPGTYASGGSSCVSCPAGSYSSSQGAISCSKCPAGKYSSSRASSCRSCPAGTFSVTAGTASCSKCAAATYSPAGSTKCTSCPAGTYASSTGSASCSKCPAGTYSPGGRSTCISCAPGYYQSSTGSSRCNICPSRTYSTSSKSTSCRTCSGVVASNRAGCHVRQVTATYRMPALTNWGSWGSWSWCPVGQFVNKFRLRVEKSLGKGDDTALNTINMYCSKTSNVYTSTLLQSKPGFWGDWKAEQRCSGFFTAVALRSEKSQGKGDDTAANNLAMFCPSARRWMYGQGQGWGSWVGSKFCPSGSAVCAMRTQVEPTQGKGDDTALNNLEFKCCRLPTVKL